MEAGEEDENGGSNNAWQRSRFCSRSRPRLPASPAEEAGSPRAAPREGASDWPLSRGEAIHRVLALYQAEVNSFRQAAVVEEDPARGAPWLERPRGSRIISIERCPPVRDLAAGNCGGSQVRGDAASQTDITARNVVLVAAAGVDAAHEGLVRQRIYHAAAAEVAAACAEFASAQCEKGEQWENAWELPSEVRQRQLNPQATNTGAAISACGQGEQWQQALGMHSELRQRQLEPKVVRTSFEGADTDSPSVAISACDVELADPGLRTTDSWSPPAAISACEKGGVGQHAPPPCPGAVDVDTLAAVPCPNGSKASQGLSSLHTGAGPWSEAGGEDAAASAPPGAIGGYELVEAGGGAGAPRPSAAIDAHADLACPRAAAEAGSAVAPRLSTAATSSPFPAAGSPPPPAGVGAISACKGIGADRAISACDVELADPGLRTTAITDSWSPPAAISACEKGGVGQHAPPPCPGAVDVDTLAAVPCPNGSKASQGLSSLHTGAGPWSEAGGEDAAASAPPGAIGGYELVEAGGGAGAPRPSAAIDAHADLACPRAAAEAGSAGAPRFSTAATSSPFPAVGLPPPPAGVEIEAGQHAALPCTVLRPAEAISACEKGIGADKAISACECEKGILGGAASPTRRLSAAEPCEEPSPAIGVRLSQGGTAAIALKKKKKKKRFKGTTGADDGASAETVDAAGTGGAPETVDVIADETLHDWTVEAGEAMGHLEAADAHEDQEQPARQEAVRSAVKKRMTKQDRKRWRRGELLAGSSPQEAAEAAAPLLADEVASSYTGPAPSSGKGNSVKVPWEVVDFFAYGLRYIGRDPRPVGTALEVICGVHGDVDIAGAGLTLTASVMAVDRRVDVDFSEEAAEFAWSAILRSQYLTRGDATRAARLDALFSRTGADLDDLRRFAVLLGVVRPPTQLAMGWWQLIAAIDGWDPG